MNILVVSQYFYPEEFKINDLVTEFVNRGHNVTVLTGKPNYPKGQYFPGYRFSGVDEETYSGAKVIRVPLIKRGKGGSINLVLNYLSYVYYAQKYIHRHTMAFDTIVCFEISPITQAYPALFCKKKYGGKVLLWIQDLWPESVTAAGNVKNKIVLGLLDKMVKHIYKGCDVLLIQSEGFKESILAKGDFAHKLLYVPNWAEDLYLDCSRQNYDKISLLMPDGFRVMFAGNIGAAQNVDAIIRAAAETKHIKEIKWIIVGDGRAREAVERMSAELGLYDTVFFLGRHPMAEMPTFFSFADGMIVSLKDEYIFSLTIPAKTQSYMASSKPIITMLNGEGNRIVDEAECGLIAMAGDYKALSQNVIRLYNMSMDERVKLGENGFRYYQRSFNKKSIVDRIIKSMEQ